MSDLLRDRYLVWLRRYLPAELLGLPAALLGGWAGSALADNLAAAAIGATWAEVVGYYLVVIARDLRANARFGLVRGGLVTARNALLEFGPAQLLDSLVIRPAALFAGMTFIPDLITGILVGKLIADLVFYVPTVIAFELRTRLLPARPPMDLPPAPGPPPATIARLSVARRLLPPLQPSGRN
jgi:hypothetical protein